MKTGIFYFSTMDFTLPSISEEDAFNNPLIEIFLSVIANEENKGREKFFEVIQPSEKTIKEISEIKAPNLIDV